MPVVKYQDLPLAPRSRSWDGDTAKKRIKSWATSDGETDWTKYRKAFLWYDAENAETQAGHKLPVADVIDGELKAVFRGIQAAANVLQGGRGGADIPDSDVPKCKSHLDRYYAKARKEYDDDSIKAPWAREEKELPRHHLRAEVEALDLEIREAEEDSDDSVEFEGYAIRWSDEATIGFFFRFKERFKRGAFKKTIRERGPNGNGQIKFLRQHNDRQSVAAKILELKEDATGLWFRARTIATGVGRDLAVELREGVVDTLSIGFDVVLEEIDRDSEPVLRTVIEARLYEISAVLWPAYAGATVEAVRALDALDEGALEQFASALEAEVREGKVLSQANKERLIEARNRIQQVIDSAGGDDEPEPDDPLEGESERDATLEVELALREREVQLTGKE
jgi:HK97 family phage prohead protease